MTPQKTNINQRSSENTVVAEKLFFFFRCVSLEVTFKLQARDITGFVMQPTCVNMKLEGKERASVDPKPSKHYD